MDAQISFGEKLLLSLFGARRRGAPEAAPEPPLRPARPSDPPAADPDEPTGDGEKPPG